MHALSFGSYWGLRIAATDPRITAIAAPWASYVDKYYLMNEESPRYKQLFGYITQSSSEEEIDRIVEQMTMDGRMKDIRCPTLLICGEYDPRAPLDELYPLFDQLQAPGELWVMPDQHHSASVSGRHGGVWDADIHAFACDWLRDRFNGIPVRYPGEVLYVEPSGAGPNSTAVKLKRRWYE